MICFPLCQEVSVSQQLVKVLYGCKNTSRIIQKPFITSVEHLSVALFDEIRYFAQKFSIFTP